jgi:hypothetical protein
MKNPAFISLLILSINCQPLWACLRATLDDRAVQWSTLIVTAKLTAIGEPHPLRHASRPSDPAAGDYQILVFTIAAPLDGKAKPGDPLPVIRFTTGGDPAKASPCEDMLTRDKIGKDFLLLLRPEADLPWHAAGEADDPRTDTVHQAKAFAIVNVQSLDDLGAEGLADAKYTISTTRTAETQFNAADAKTQAETVVNASDDTEEQQAAHALAEMGPKALPMIKDEMLKADDVSKNKLAKIAADLSPPGLGDPEKPE